jgi:uncharacterized alpha-E superfamily protein
MLSRVADHLYWLSRYLERAEHTARLIDVSLNLSLELSPAASEQRWGRILRSLRTAPPENGALDAYSITQRLAFDVTNHNAILVAIASARENAQHVRELISSEMWEQLNRLYLQVREARLEEIWNDNPYEFFRNVKEGAHLFQGITDSTMTQGEGWHFIQVGRLTERAYSLASLLDVYFRELPPFPGDDSERTESASAYLEWVGLLKSCTAFEAYCKVYTADIKSECVAEFLLLNPDFPHSVCFAATRLQTALHAIADATETHKAGRINKLAGRLRALLEFGQLDELMSGDLHDSLGQIQQLCGQIHNTLYQTYIAYPIDKELSLS